MQRCYCELEELTVDDFWQIADAGDQELWSLAHSSRQGTSELDAEDSDMTYNVSFGGMLNLTLLQVDRLRDCRAYNTDHLPPSASVLCVV